MMWTLLAIAIVAAQSVWEGVYSDAQAARGKVAYDLACSACHREDLSGGSARPLVGDTFWRSWGEDSLGSLYSVVRETMPRREPGSLGDQDYADIVAYILQRNAYPAGTRELTRVDVAAVRVTGKDGPLPVPNFSLVRVVGCLQERAPGAWVLARSSDPVRTRTPAPSTAAERQQLESALLGDQMIELMDAYTSPAGHSGERVEITGLLIRGNPTRLNFSSMQSFAPTCP